jgi:hypothetical protein
VSPPCPRRAASPATALALLLAVLLLAGCASVPDSSPVQVLRQVTEGDGPALPPGPAPNSSPLDLVRGFVNASASSDNRHAAARLFLTGRAQSWDDAVPITVINDQLALNYGIPPGQDDRAQVRMRATQVGRLNRDGSFVQDEASIDLDFQVAKDGGQWRIAAAPRGVVLRLPDLRANYKPVTLYFMDPVQHVPVCDLRYLASNPPRSLPSRVVDTLLEGPSSALAGAAVSAIPKTAHLRSNVTLGPNASVSLDMTELGALDEGQRRLIAAQLVLSLAEVNVDLVHLTADGAPLMAGHPDLSREMFADMDGDDDPRPDVPGLAVIAGRARMLDGVALGGPLAGPSGDGSYALTSATTSTDGLRLAAVNRLDGRQLVVGRLNGPLAQTGVRATALTRPTWTPTGTEVWTVRDSLSVSRVVFDQAGNGSVQPADAGALNALGPINDLRISGDGMRVAAIVGGQLAVGAISRSASRQVSIGNVRVLRPIELTDLTGVDWRADDQLAVVGKRPDVAVAIVSVDGLDFHPLPWNNLTPPLSAVAVAPGRPLLVSDQNGLWSYGADEVGTWRQIAGGTGVVAGYPG